MADTLILQIGTLPDVRVSSLGSVRRYASLEHGAIEAGTELGVSAVLEGSIQKRHQRICVTSRLLRVSDGQALWAGQFDEPVSDLFALQDAIAARVMEAALLDLEALGAAGFGVAYDIASIHAALNEREPACTALAGALDDHSQMIGLLELDPDLDPLRAEPCFESVSRRLYSIPGRDLSARL